MTQVVPMTDSHDSMIAEVRTRVRVSESKRRESVHVRADPRQTSESNPLADLDEWEDFLRERYPAPQEKSSFRDYGTTVRPAVREFYRLNHRYQTRRLRPARKSGSIWRRTIAMMGIWEAMEFLNTLVDDSDPDTELTQIEHLMQAAEAIRADGHPALVHPDRLDPRPGQDPLPLRRAAVGRRRRHVPGRLPLFGPDRLPRVLRGQPRLRASPSIRPSAASTSRAAGSTTSTCRGATTNTCTTSSRTIFPKRGWR